MKKNKNIIIFICIIIFAFLILLNFNNSDFVTSSFKGKTLLVTGDSITRKNYHTDKTWSEYIGDALNLTVKNDGKDGTGLIYKYRDDEGIFYRIDTWDEIYGDFDFILLMGNMNDSKLIALDQLPLGDINDEAYPKTQTQYSIVRAVIEKILEKYPNKPFAWIISTPRRDAYEGLPTKKAWGGGSFFEDYCYAIIELCKHYNVPYLDLYHSSGLRPWLDTDSFAKDDRTHPNTLAHKTMAKRILPFVKQYL